MENLKQKTVTGIKWSAFGQFGLQGVSIISSVVLARLLTPNEFGLIAMITVLTGLGGIFANFGFSAALIQKKEVSAVELSSVFWFNIGITTLLTLLFIFLSPSIAKFYNEPSLRYITMVVALNFLASGLNNVPIALVNRNMEFKKNSIVLLVSIITSYVVSIFLAYYGFGVWSLVAQGLVNNFLITALFWFWSDWKPLFLFDRNSLKEMSRFSTQYFFIHIFDYIATNIDTLLIGKYINKKQLGEYGRSYAFLMLPVVNISGVLSKVILPSLSRIQDDKQRVADIYFKAARVLAFVTFPMMIGLAVVAEPFVFVVFGEKWMGMVPMLQFFSLIGVLASLNALHDSIVLSQGRTDLLIKVAPLEKGLLISSVGLGLIWGVYGVIICKACAFLIIVIPKFRILAKSISVSLGAVFRNFLPLALITATMGGVTFAIDRMLLIQYSQIVKLILDVLIGAAIYLSLNMLFYKRIFKDLKSLRE